MTTENLQPLLATLVKKIDAADPQLLLKFPVETIAGFFENQIGTGDYSYLSKATLHFNRSLNDFSAKNKAVIGVYYNLLLLTFIMKSTEKLARLDFPEEVVSEFRMKFGRISKKISNWSDTIVYQPLENDKYLKDLAICRLMLIPVGPQYIEIGKISRRLLFMGGVEQFFSGFLFVLRHGGFSGYYKLTTNQLDPDLVAQFNPQGWDKLFVCVTELLKKNRHIKGIIGSSWFFDPQLDTIDPDIAYIREKFISRGGRLYMHHTDSHVIKDAIFMNNRRKKLYDENVYKPINYMMILPRKNLLKYTVRMS